MGHYDEYSQPPTRSQSDRIDSFGTSASAPVHDKPKSNNGSTLQTSGQRTSQPQSRSSLPERNRSESGIRAPHLGDVPARKPTTQSTIAELQNELMVAHMQLDEFVTRSASMHSNDPYRVGDDKIARDRDLVVADVRQWSRNFNRSSRGVLRTLIAGDEPGRPFEKVSSEYDHYLTRHPR
jgi:hypothetical protein